MKTAQEKLDWLKENGVPGERILKRVDGDHHAVFLATYKEMTIIFNEGEPDVLELDHWWHWEIVTPPKKTRKLYLWDSKTNSGNIERSSYYYDNDCCALDEGLHNVLKNRQWKRKVESSMIEVDEDGNICGGKE